MEENDFNRMQNDDNNWKWGLLYFNPDDPRILVPKRNQYLGLTLNFGNRRTGLYLLLCGLAISLVYKIMELIQRH
jgi:uncharacterized membrane protein